MARGWGRNEEDQEAAREQAREAVRAASTPLAPEDAAAAARRRSLELSLARIADLLAHTDDPARRAALLAAEADLRAELGEEGEEGDEGGT